MVIFPVEFDDDEWIKNGERIHPREDNGNRKTTNNEEKKKNRWKNFLNLFHEGKEREREGDSLDHNSESAVLPFYVG